MKLLILMILISSMALADATKEEAFGSIVEANETINFMELDGFKVEYLRDLLETAMVAYERANSSDVFTYDAVIEITNGIKDTREQAYNLRDLIRSAEIDLENYRSEGVDVEEPAAILAAAKEAFNHERYNEAETLLQESIESMEKVLESSSIIGLIAQSSKSFLSKNWLEIIILCAVLALLFRYSWRRALVRKLRRSIKSMKAEKVTIAKLMKDAQKDRFQDAKLSESVYTIRIEKYQDRLNEINYKLPVAEKELNVLTKKHKKKEKKSYHAKKGRKGKHRNPRRKHIRK